MNPFSFLPATLVFQAIAVLVALVVCGPGKPSSSPYPAVIAALLIPVSDITSLLTFLVVLIFGGFLYEMRKVK